MNVEELINEVILKCPDNVTGAINEEVLRNLLTEFANRSELKALNDFARVKGQNGFILSDNDLNFILISSAGYFRILNGLGDFTIDEYGLTISSQTLLSLIMNELSIQASFMNINAVSNINISSVNNDINLSPGIGHDLTIANIRFYEDHDSADADSTLNINALYKITGERTIYQKP